MLAGIEACVEEACVDRALSRSIGFHCAACANAARVSSACSTCTQDRRECIYFYMFVAMTLDVSRVSILDDGMWCFRGNGN